MKKQREKYITEDTKVNIDEDVFKVLAEELICELFVEYVNDKYRFNVVELNSR